MPPPARTKSDVPDKIKCFLFHGTDLIRGSGGQWVGPCVFCGSQGKHAKTFYAAEDTGLWDCKSCGAKGNPLTFLRQLWDVSDAATSDYSALSEDRGLLYPDTCMRWGAARCAVDGRTWLLPGYDAAGKLCTLYRYSPAGPSRRMTLLATPGFGHGLHGSEITRTTETVDVLEGPWDGMAFEEAMRVTKMLDDRYALTANAEASLWAGSLVLAVPGCSHFKEEWLPLFAGKHVRLWYDSDHPKKHPTTGSEVGLQGWRGMERVAGLLANAEAPPASIAVVHWGGKEDGYDPGHKSGYDVRDALSGSGNVASQRVAALGRLLALSRPVPAGWVPGRSRASVKAGAVEIEPLPCKDWKTLVNAWRQAMNFIDGLDRALACVLATVLSTDAALDQLWFKVIGPPSCGKSTIAEAAAVAKKWVLAKSTIRGFHSGYRESADASEDNSLLALCRGKTLMTKDGDALLKAPNKEQILSEARDVYDRVSRTHYRNKASKDYEDHPLTWVIYGTKSLRELDQSELGARFLDCVIMEEIDDDVEDAINTQIAHRMKTTLNGGKAAGTGHDDADMLKVKRLTAGYINYLRENDERLLSQVDASDERLRQIGHLGKFVSYLRARPSLHHDETAEREMSGRLVSQHTKLAMCLAVVLNKREIDAEVMARVGKVAMDTARGYSLDLCRVITKRDVDPLLPGCETAALALWTGMKDGDLRTMLRFLKRIKVVTSLEKDDLKRLGLPVGTRRWQLAPKFRKLFEEVEAVGGNQ